jgi:hypothetical protein
MNRLARASSPNGHLPLIRGSLQTTLRCHSGEPKPEHHGKETHRHCRFTSNQSHHGVTPSFHPARNAGSSRHGRFNGFGRYDTFGRQRSRRCAADYANTASNRLYRELLGCSGITCGLDHKQADGWLLVAGRPHSFAGGRCLCLHPSVCNKLTGPESMQSEKHTDL